MLRNINFRWVNSTWWLITIRRRKRFRIGPLRLSTFPFLPFELEREQLNRQRVVGLPVNLSVRCTTRSLWRADHNILHAWRIIIDMYTHIAYNSFKQPKKFLEQNLVSSVPHAQVLLSSSGLFRLVKNSF